MEKTIKKRIDSLIAEINNHNYAYYVLDDPKLTDIEYDALFRELETLERDNPNLISKTSPTQRVGHPVTSGFKSYEHSIPMLSLSNAINDEEINDFHKRIVKWLNNSEVNFVAEPKIDGLGAVSYTHLTLPTKA